MNRTIFETMDDALLRAETILHLGSQLTGGGAPDSLIEGPFEEDEAICEQFGAPFDEMPRWELVEHLMEHCWMNQQLGWLVQFATPIRTFSKGSGHSSFSWGRYYTKWIYAETFEEAVDAGLAWAGDMKEKDRAKSA